MARSTPSSSPRGWARCLDNVADVLRRGAWYPIVDETDDGKVVIEVRKKPVRVSRIDVAVRESPPDRWSIVVRTGVLRPTLGSREGEVTTTYAVCPECQERQDFSGKPDALKCLGCKTESQVDWSETC